MKRVVKKNKWIAILLCITMLLCISPWGPIAAFGEDGDAAVSDSADGNTTDSGDAINDGSGDGEGIDGVTDGDMNEGDGTEGEGTDGDGVVDENGDGTEGTPDGEEGQPADGDQPEENQPDGTQGEQPADGEQQEEIKDEDVPKTEIPAASNHINGCSDECTGEGCTCPCHLYQRLMACETYEELMLLIEATPEENLMALTEDEVMQIEAKIIELEPQPLPPVGEEEPLDENGEPFVSEIFYPTVNFDDVAPFGDPVVG